ncbi:hypothetical protein AVEN_160553-1 [Araneus ventricosus]|uniref:Uncharacterized protein n=1 Tax=Araneus ventricosus TaxID=182803 RepID=A0A4Y1ZJA7_ARAVE|nr:hypothetical protein AVEN_160553-1 [Araneus ventricosus]
MHKLKIGEQYVLILVALTSRFEATRGLFWDGPRHFEPRSGRCLSWQTLSKLPYHISFPSVLLLGLTPDWVGWGVLCTGSAGGRLASYGIGFRTCYPPAPRPKPYRYATAALKRITRTNY